MITRWLKPLANLATRRIILGTMLALSLTLEMPVYAQMVVNKLILDFMPGEVSRDDIEVVNEGADPLYAQIELYEVLNPGEENETLRKVEGGDDMRLIISPRKMIVPPRARKLVRIVSFKPPTDKEHIYRVKILPVVGELESDKTALKIVVGYELLVIVRPKSPQPGLILEREGRQLQIRNQGNTNVLLYGGKQCRAKDDCIELPVRRAYAGNNWVLSLPFDAPVEFYQQLPGQKNKVVRVP